MENGVIVSLDSNTQLMQTVAAQLNIEIASLEIRKFPDDESYIRIHSDVRNKHVILMCGLDRPNEKILPLLFTASTLKELGASDILLISPYLAYMRQDKIFKPGEAMTSRIFAKLLSQYIDGLITVDPHLHRIKILSEIYHLSLISVLHATRSIAAWIRQHVPAAIIIGPDEESRQWVTEVAEFCSSPYVIMDKIRKGDRDVEILLPEIKEKNKTPILIDDIISTGTSMQAAIAALISKGLTSPICIGVHGLFDDATYQHLLTCGAGKVLTCNTIVSKYEKIDISNIIIDEIRKINFSNKGCI